MPRLVVPQVESDSMNIKTRLCVAVSVGWLSWIGPASAQQSPEPDPAIGEGIEEEIISADEGAAEPELRYPSDAPVAPPPPPADSAPPPPAWGIGLGPVRFAPSAEVWMRGEARVDAPGAAGRESFFIASRIRLGLETRWESVRLFVQVQDSRSLGQFGPGNPNGATTSLYQGWVQVGGDDLYLRAGRQEIALGGERMLGPLLWSNSPRSFDGVRLHGHWGEIAADVFGAMMGMPRTITGPSGEIAENWGDYLGMARVGWTPGAELSLEPYILFRHDGPVEPPASAMDPTPFLERQRNIANLGVRATGTIASLIAYELEGMVQTGRAARADHLAFGLIANATVQIGTDAGLSATGGVNYGSGASADGSIDEFDNFFPTNHLFYGYADYFGLRNVIDGWARVTLAPPSIPQLRLWADGHVFAFPETSGRWTNAGGAQIASANMTADGFAGGEVDLELRWTPVDTFFVWAGYAIFIPASGASTRGVDDISHWAYLMLGARLQ